MEQIIIDEINVYKENLDIAEKISLEYPFFKSTSDSETRIYQSEILFYQGTRALSQQLVYLNKYLDKTRNLSLNHNTILELGFSTSLVSVSTKIYVFFAFVFGLFFSMMILFLRTQSNKN